MLRVSHCLIAFGLLACAAAGSLSRAQGPAKGEDGFTPLFNGKDLTGWMYKPTPKESLEGKTETADGRITVENGIIVVHEKSKSGKGGTTDLYTTRDFAKDFTLKLEFRAAPKADSGVYIRGPQLQVRDYPTAGPYKPKSFRNADWNDLEIIVRAKVLVTKVNGKTLTDKDAFELNIKDGKQSATLNGKEVALTAVQLTYGPAAECKCNGEVLEAAFPVPTKGGIGLQAETGKFEFRNIRVKEMQ